MESSYLIFLYIKHFLVRIARNIHQHPEGGSKGIHFFCHTK